MRLLLLRIRLLGRVDSEEHQHDQQRQTAVETNVAPVLKRLGDGGVEEIDGNGLGVHREDVGSRC